MGKDIIFESGWRIKPQTIICDHCHHKKRYYGTTQFFARVCKECWRKRDHCGLVEHGWVRSGKEEVE